MIKTFILAAPGQSQHILLICSRLDLPGGIERAIVVTANLFQQKGHAVTILILDETKETFYPLRDGVKLVLLPLHFGITGKGNMLSRKLNFLADIKSLRTTFRKLDPDIIIGTEYSFSIASFLAGRQMGAKIFAWEHHHFYWLKKSRFWNYLFKKIYRKLDAVICLNEAENKLFQQQGCRTVTIPNFINRGIKASLTSRTIISVGWLINRKGVDLIPEIAASIFEEHPDWRWIIVGAGDEETSLRKKIADNSLSGNVIIQAPVSPDLTSIYEAASLFIMPSRFECFPMVLLEAMSHGIPAVSFDCPTGPAFIITDKVDGVLIEQDNTTAMAEAIITLIKNEEQRKIYGDAAYQNILRFSPDKVYACWTGLFAEHQAKVTKEQHSKR